MIDRSKEIEYAEIKKFILDRYVFYYKMIFNNNDFYSTLKIYTREMMNNKIFDLVSYMFGKTQKQKVRLETPKTWRDWIKKKHNNKKWMKLIIKKFPIKYNYHHYILNEYTSFPDLELPPDFEGRKSLIYYYYEYKGENIEDNKNNS